MQAKTSTTILTCDRCGKEHMFKDDDIPTEWIHMQEYFTETPENKFNPIRAFDFCPECARDIYHDMRLNKEWFAHYFGHIPGMITENDYITLKQEYEQLKTKYDDVKQKYDDKMKASSFGF